LDYSLYFGSFCSFRRKKHKEINEWKEKGKSLQHGNMRISYRGIRSLSEERTNEERGRRTGEEEKIANGSHQRKFRIRREINLDRTAVLSLEQRQGKVERLIRLELVSNAAGPYPAYPAYRARRLSGRVKLTLRRGGDGTVHSYPLPLNATPHRGRLSGEAGKN